jgi:hypothetical protein
VPPESRRVANLSRVSIASRLWRFEACGDEAIPPSFENRIARFHVCQRGGTEWGRKSWTMMVHSPWYICKRRGQKVWNDYKVWGSCERLSNPLQHGIVDSGFVGMFLRFETRVMLITSINTIFFPRFLESSGFVSSGMFLRMPMLLKGGSLVW